MRALFSSLRRHAPFLYSERGAIALTRALRSAGRGGGTALADGDNRGVAAEGTAASDLDARGATIADCALARATISGARFADGTCSRTHLRGAALRDWQAEGSTWDVVDLERADIAAVVALGSRWSVVSLREARLTDVDFEGATLVLCDFTRAHLTGVRFTGARLSGVDFGGAVLQGIDFAGADLRSCLFSGAWCGGADFSSAAVEGADFRDAGGLDDSARADLAARGARVGGGAVRRFWEKVLGGDDPAAAQPRIRAAVGTSWALLALLLPALFFARAILNPVDPEAPPESEDAGQADAPPPEGTPTE